MPFCQLARQTGWCGLCYEGVQARRYTKGHYGYRSCPVVRKERVVFTLKKRAGVPGGRGPGGGVIADGFEGRFPALVEFLSAAAYADGSPRLPGSMTLFSDTGLLKACLNDKDAGLSAFMSSDTLAGLLETAEVGLQEDRLDWRAPGRKGGAKR